MNIPKLIHQSYISEDKIKPKFKKYISKLKSLNPDWHWEFWSDEDNRDLIKSDYPWFLSCYDNYPYPIQRADAVRYFYMHKYGGIYLDLDMFPIQPIAGLVQKVYDCKVQSLVHAPRPKVLLFEEYPNNFSLAGALYNAIMISEPGASFWSFVHFKLQDLFNSPKQRRKIHEPGEMQKAVFDTTGPNMLCRAFKEYYSMTWNGEVQVLPYYYSNPSWLPPKDEGGDLIDFSGMETGSRFRKSAPKVPWTSPPPSDGGQGFDLDARRFPESYFMHDSGRMWAIKKH